MKRAEGGRSSGYTIVEVMIFLAVSGAMFISAMAFINGKQARTEFTSAVRDFDSQLSDLSNDVSDGYFSNVTAAGSQYYCQASGVNFTFSTAALPSQGCILIGKSLQFGPNGNKQNYSVINLVGRQFVSGNVANGDVQTMDDSGVVAMMPTQTSPFNNVPDASADTLIGGGVTVECVLYSTTAGTDIASVSAATHPCAAAGLTKVDTVSFITTFHAMSFTNTNPQANSSQFDIVVANAAPQNVGRTKAQVATMLDGFTNANTVKNPAGGVYVCMQSNGSNQYGLVTIGGSNTQSNSATQIFTGTCN